MKRLPGLKLLIFIIGSIGGNSPLHAGDSVGGGIAENNLLFAYQNMERYLELCLASKSCQLIQKEAVILQKILKAMPEERKTKNQVSFESEMKKPGFFIVDGQVRAAKTGLEIGTAIWVNVDMLYYKDAPLSIRAFSQLRAIDIASAVSLLVHELGHHTGEKDHTMLDVIGAKVQTMVRAHSLETHAGPFARQIIAASFDYGNADHSDLLLRDGKKIDDLTALLKSSLRCHSETDQLFGFWLWNLHWNRAPLVIPVGDRVSPLTLHGRMVLMCGDDTHLDTIFDDFEAVIPLAKDKAGELEIVAGKTKFRQIDCEKNPLHCP